MGCANNRVNTRILNCLLSSDLIHDQLALAPHFTYLNSLRDFRCCCHLAFHFHSHPYLRLNSTPPTLLELAEYSNKPLVCTRNRKEIPKVEPIDSDCAAAVRSIIKKFGYKPQSATKRTTLGDCTACDPVASSPILSSEAI
jgi:hypothetical protein